MMAIVPWVDIVLLFPIVMHELHDRYVDHKDRVVNGELPPNGWDQCNHRNHHNTILNEMKLRIIVDKYSITNHICYILGVRSRIFENLDY